MTLADIVQIDPRFQRAVRIDADLESKDALRGFVCPPSSVATIRAMATHVADTAQGAFTWTGPYGSGKSSLVIALSSLLGGDDKLRQDAAAIVGQEVAEEIWSKLPPQKMGWRTLGVVGSKDSPTNVIGDALNRSGFVEHTEKWTEAAILKSLRSIAAEEPSQRGGLIVFVDELGKLLEAIARDRGDIHILQQIAELASRSGGRLIFVGILHQAFDEYAGKLSRDLREEWSKIQGRFIDLAINVGGEEQLSILAAAIKGDVENSSSKKSAQIIGTLIRKTRPGTSPEISVLLESCWPLHPITAALLGPISRRRFGQNQRSIFGFLNSAEPYGFRDFLKGAETQDLYEPDRLFDYLRVNLEPAILASPDGHRWAIAVEAIERCASMGGDDLHLRLLKTIAVTDLFRERSGLSSNLALLRASVPLAMQDDVEEALKQITKWSFIIYKKFLDAYSIYAGSDFDIENAIDRVNSEGRPLDFSAVRDLSGLQPILCKRHYHDRGALRWFDVSLVPISRLEEHLHRFSPGDGTIGEFVLVVPDSNENHIAMRDIVRSAVDSSGPWDSVVGVSSHAWFLVQLAREVQSLERVRMHPDLQGDAVARLEVNARLTAAQSQFESELQKAFDHAEWYRKDHPAVLLQVNAISGLASDLADRRYAKCPRIHNEMLNRAKPSSNAVAAQNSLLKRMVLNEGQDRLGIIGYPAEGGIFASVIDRAGLYRKGSDGFEFADPRDGVDPMGLSALWDVAESFLRLNDDRPVTLREIYDIWGAVPFGLKRGLMPILAVAFILSMKSSVALYRESIFQPAFKDLDIDYLVKDPALIRLRWMDLNDDARDLLSGLADLVRDLDRTNSLENLEPIDVGRGLVSIFDGIAPWTKKTLRLSANAIKIRTVFKKANDPNRLIFNDLPGLFANDSDAKDVGILENVRAGLEELTNAFPELLHRLRNNMLAELQVPNASPNAIGELRLRAENIRQLAGDFRLDAFVGRLATFEGSDADMEGLISLAANKPPKDWVDADVDRAAVSLTELAQQFNKAETFARVKGRQDKRHAMAVVVGIAGRPTPIFEEFNINDREKVQVDELIDKVEAALAMGQRNLVLAALAEVSARVISSEVREEQATSYREANV